MVLFTYMEMVAKRGFSRVIVSKGSEGHDAECRSCFCLFTRIDDEK